MAYSGFSRRDVIAAAPPAENSLLGLADLRLHLEIASAACFEKPFTLKSLDSLKLVRARADSP